MTQVEAPPMLRVISSVLMFFGCIALWLGRLFLVGFEELVASSRVVVFALLPIVLFVLAWYPNRSLFS